MIDINKYLVKVSKPAQYLGNELNSVHKNKNDYKLHSCFIFPDLYEIGMSSLAVHILYNIVNNESEHYIERAFAPDIDLEEILRKKDLPLFSLETKTALNKFDVLGFTLSYELSYTNVLNIINLGKMELESKNRLESDPILIAGGTGANNPIVMEEFFDAFIIGEGEEVFLEILNAIKENQHLTKKEKLEKLSNIDGVYVPLFKKEVKKRIVADLNNLNYEYKQIVPFVKVVHERAILEIQRGCTRGCRFCQAGIVYRPIREKNLSKNKDEIRNLLDSTGYNEISLTSLSSSDYSKISELINIFSTEYKSENISVSLPSLRMNTHSVDIAAKIEEGKKTGFTFAPEAGSQRMRDIINKGVSEEEIMETAISAVTNGWTRLKFYFMIGLPFETDEDVYAIGKLINEVLGKCVPINRSLKVTVSVSNFVPKPHTPFQWEKQINLSEIDRKQNLLREMFFKNRRVTLRLHDKELSYIEGYISRGNEKTGKLIKRAWELGAKFESWKEHFKFNVWIQALNDTNIKEEEFFGKQDLELPWDFINIGVSRDFLMKELEKAKEISLTKDCRLGCNNCGMIKNLNCEMKYSV